MINKLEMINKLKERYNCEIYESPWGINFYYKNLYLQISYNKEKDYFEWGNLYENKKQIWSTGEFARSDKLTYDQLINLLDNYFPINLQFKLF